MKLKKNVPKYLSNLLAIDLRRNHVNETARHGIVAHRLWEENLGNITEVFVNDSFRFVARSLWFHCTKELVMMTLVIFPKNDGQRYYALRFRLHDCALYLYAVKKLPKNIYECRICIWLLI